MKGVWLEAQKKWMAERNRRGENKRERQVKTDAEHEQERGKRLKGKQLFGILLNCSLQHCSFLLSL